MSNEIAIVSNSNDDRFDRQLNLMDDQIASALPGHISVSKFKRVCFIAVQQEPSLLEADRSSLLRSCLECASDGLVPDRKEAVLVVYNVKNKVTNKYVKKVQYLPMVAGLLKLARNSGEILSISAHVVHEKDNFRYWIDDAGEHLEHNFDPFGDRGEKRGVYARATLKDGTSVFTPMDKQRIARLRAASRSGDREDSPWNKWPDEMEMSKAIKHLCSRLPKSTDREGLALARAIARDEDHQRMLEAASPRPMLADFRSSTPHDEDGVILDDDAEEKRVAAIINQHKEQLHEDADEYKEPSEPFDDAKAEHAPATLPPAGVERAGPVSPSAGPAAKSKLMIYDHNTMAELKEYPRTAAGAKAFLAHLTGNYNALAGDLEALKALHRLHLPAIKELLASKDGVIAGNADSLFTFVATAEEFAKGPRLPI